MKADRRPSGGRGRKQRWRSWRPSSKLLPPLSGLLSSNHSLHSSARAFEFAYKPTKTTPGELSRSFRRDYSVSEIICRCSAIGVRRLHSLSRPKKRICATGPHARPCSCARLFPQFTATMSKRKVAEIFETMAYGPAPEDSSPAEAWLDSHKRITGLFINNKFEHPAGRQMYEPKNPATGKVLCKSVQGTNEDVDRAVAAARKAFEGFSKTPGHVRARYLYAIARVLNKHARLMAVLESMDNGKSIRETRDADVALVIRHFYYHAGWAQLAETEMAGYSPLGVIGQVIPWNFPLLMLAWKIAPALAMGNCIVLKPATYTPLSAILFAQIVAEAGVPPGVVNILTGSGKMGGYLCNHPGIDKVAFTGSTGVGQLLRRETAGLGIKMSLELGGKSPIVVFNSADLDSTVDSIVNAIWFNQGQVCCAGSRLLVQEDVKEVLIEKLKRKLSVLRVGNPLDKCIDMGAIVDKAQYDSVMDYIRIAKEDEGELQQGACSEHARLACSQPIACSQPAFCVLAASLLAAGLFAASLLAMRHAPPRSPTPNPRVQVPTCSSRLSPRSRRRRPTWPTVCTSHPPSSVTSTQTPSSSLRRSSDPYSPSSRSALPMRRWPSPTTRASASRARCTRSSSAWRSRRRSASRRE